jgi:hypothetical protein
MNIKTHIKRCLFYWASSFALATMVYYALLLVMPSPSFFGGAEGMPLYHQQYPLYYIAIPCFFYGILATLFADKFTGKPLLRRIALTVAIIVLVVFVSSPFGGILWYYHNMQAGFYTRHGGPSPHFSFLVEGGIRDGLINGWFLLLFYSFPYNLICSILCFFLTGQGARIITPDRNT